MKKVTKTKVTKKVAAVKTKKVNTVKPVNNKVVLTLKQAQAIETLLFKAGKNSKVLTNKISALNA